MAPHQVNVLVSSLRRVFSGEQHIFIVCGYHSNTLSCSPNLILPHLPAHAPELGTMRPGSAVGGLPIFIGASPRTGVTHPSFLSFSPRVPLRSLMTGNVLDVILYPQKDCLDDLLTLSVGNFAQPPTLFRPGRLESCSGLFFVADLFSVGRRCARLRFSPPFLRIAPDTPLRSAPPSAGQLEQPTL